MTDDVVLVVGGQEWRGWETVRVSVGIERTPPSFDLEVTETFTDASTIAVVPGDAVVVRFGTDAVITGYVDRYDASVSPTEHTVRISGRGRTQDLVDCAAILQGAQVGDCFSVQLVRTLCDLFGITVVSQAGVGKWVPMIGVNLGETAWEIIERVARWNGWLAYEDAHGDLVLAEGGTGRHASGFTLPGNAQAAQVIYSMDQRFSEYHAFLLAVDKWGEIGRGNYFPVVADNGVPRYRPMVVVSEQFDSGESIAQERALWEAKRRAGRSQAVTVLADWWRDNAEVLWTPNMLADVFLPALKVTPTEPWTIAAVDYSLEPGGGTTASVMLMPPEAFLPQPGLLAPTYQQALQAAQS